VGGSNRRRRRGETQLESAVEGLSKEAIKEEMLKKKKNPSIRTARKLKKEFLKKRPGGGEKLVGCA